MIALAWAAVARAGCTVPGPGMVELWPLDQDGAGLYGVTSMSPARGASLDPDRFGSTLVSTSADGPVGGWFAATLPPLAPQWTVDARVRVPPGSSATVLALDEPGDGSLAIRVDCAAGAVSALDGAGGSVSVPATCDGGWLHVAVSSDGSTMTLTAGASSSGAVSGTELPRPGRGAELRVGVLAPASPGAAVDVRDVALHAGAVAPDALEALQDDPWCRPKARRPLPYHLPFDRQTFTLGGYYEGIAGQVGDHPALARQRLVLRPEIQISRYSQVALQARMLETRGLDDTGSLLRPDAVRSTVELGDWLPLIEQVYVSTHGETFVLPLYFAAGRFPTTFGLGLDDQNSLGSFDPPAPSAAALFVEEPTDDATVRPDALGDRSFGTSMDGVEGFVRVGQIDETRGRDAWFGLRGGRHNPWCNGRVSLSCPAQTLSVFELGFSAFVDARIEQPGGSWTVLGGLDLGRRKASVDPASWFVGGSHGWFGRASFVAVAPRIGAVWTRIAAELVADEAARGGVEAPLPPELEGGVAGGAGQVDLAVRQFPWVSVGVAGGFAAPLVPGQPIRGLHPDFDADLVAFSQVVAEKTAAAAADPLVTPSMGGVWDGAYARLSVVFHPVDVAEIPIAVMPAWSFGDTGAVPQGFLGPELDGAWRIRVASWRVGVEAGVLFPQGALPDYAGEHPWVADARLGRNL